MFYPLYSGTRKAKQPRERKRSRSEEVVLIEEGKLISKTGEPSQLPIRFTHPSSSPRPRVPSVGLPFTPGGVLMLFLKLKSDEILACMLRHSTLHLI